MTATATHTTAPSRTAAVGRSPRRRPSVTVGAAALAAAAVWLVAGLLGVGLEVAVGGRAPTTVGLPLVVAAALAAGLAGWGSLALLRRLTGRARPLWTALAAAVLVASFAPVLGADATAGARIALGLTHVVVAAVLIPGLRRIPDGLTTGPAAAHRSGRAAS